MKTLIICAALVLAATVAWAQTCPPANCTLTCTPPPSTPSCTIISDGVQHVTVNAAHLPYTGSAAVDTIGVAIVKTSGIYTGFTAVNGSIIPSPSGTGTLTANIGYGSGGYAVHLVNAKFGNITCATFSLSQ